MKKKRTFTINIREVLRSFRERDISFFENLSEKDLNSVAPLVLQRWVSGIDDESQILHVNRFVNPYVFSLPSHKMLLLRLLSVSYRVRSQNVRWVHAKSKRQSKLPLGVEIIKQYCHYNTKQAKEALPLLTTEQLKQWGQDLGIDDKQLKELSK